MVRFFPISSSFSILCLFISKILLFNTVNCSIFTSRSYSFYFYHIQPISLPITYHWTICLWMLMFYIQLQVHAYWHKDKHFCSLSNACILCSLCFMLYIYSLHIKPIAWFSLLTLQVLRQVEENLKQFNANYMILKDYFCEVEDKLKSLCQQVSQVLLYCKIITIRLVCSVQSTGI